MKNKIILGLALLMGISFTGNYVTATSPLASETVEDINGKLNELRTLANEGKISELISNLRTYKTQYPIFLNKFSNFLSTHLAMWNKIIEGLSNNPVLLNDFMQALNTNKNTWKQLIIAIQNNPELLSTFVSTMSSNPALWNKLLIVLKNNPNTEIEVSFYEILNNRSEAIISLLNRVKATMSNNPSIKQNLIAIVLANPTKWAGYLSKIKTNYPEEWEKVKVVLSEHFDIQ